MSRRSGELAILLRRAQQAGALDPGLTEEQLGALTVAELAARFDAAADAAASPASSAASVSQPGSGGRF